jgi:hypothetical protein
MEIDEEGVILSEAKDLAVFPHPQFLPFKPSRIKAALA